MGTPSKVTCDSIAKMVNFHVLQQFVGVWNLRVAISNKRHTRKIKLIDAYSPESDDPRKSNHRKKQWSSETEREIEELRLQWCSQLLLDHDLNCFLKSFNSKSSVLVFDLNTRLYHTKFEDLTSTRRNSGLWCDQRFWAWACFVRCNFCHHETRSNIFGAQRVAWNRVVFCPQLENSCRRSFVHNQHWRCSSRPKFFARAAMDEKTQELGGDSAGSPRA